MISEFVNSSSELWTGFGIGTQGGILLRKWQKGDTGPYLVVRKIEPVNFVLQKFPIAKPFVVHVNKLKKCFNPTSLSWINAEKVVEGETNLTNECVSQDLCEAAESSLSMIDDADLQKESSDVGVHAR